MSGSSSGDYNGGKGNEDYGYDDVPLYFFMAKPRDNMQYKVPTSILTLQPLLSIGYSWEISTQCLIHQ